MMDVHVLSGIIDFDIIIRSLRLRVQVISLNVLVFCAFGCVAGLPPAQLGRLMCLSGWFPKPLLRWRGLREIGDSYSGALKQIPTLNGCLSENVLSFKRTSWHSSRTKREKSSKRK